MLAGRSLADSASVEVEADVFDGERLAEAPSHPAGEVRALLCRE
jgi:hypothetical protein